MTQGDDYNDPELLDIYTPENSLENNRHSKRKRTSYNFNSTKKKNKKNSIILSQEASSQKVLQRDKKDICPQ